jgi:histidine triad (HIT) family protein
VTGLTSDFYCDEVLSGKTPVEVVIETPDVLAFRHTRPAYPVHIVVIPKRHIASLVTLTDADDGTLIEMLRVIRNVAAQVLAEQGACRVVTNLGTYQDSKHLHWHVISGERLSTPPQ